MNLKRQLLLVSLLALMLPWAGCEFISGTESALRSNQQQMLSGTALAIAESLSRDREEFPEAAPSDFRFGDQLYGHPLENAPLIDGYVDDWTTSEGALRDLPGVDGRIRFAIGLNEQFLYLYVHVRDDNVIYSPPGRIPGDEPEFVDRVRLVSSSPPYLQQTLTFSAEAPGPVVTWLNESGSRGEEPTIRAYWQDVPNGYHLEARIPRRLLGTHLGLVVENTASPNDRAIPSSSFNSRSPGAFVTLSPELTERANDLVQRGMRLIVTDASGWRIASVGDVDTGRTSASPGPPALLRLAYNAIVESGTEAVFAEPDPSGREQQSYIVSALDGSESAAWFRSGESGRAIVAVAEPVRDGNTTIGAVILQQGTEAILSLRTEGLSLLVTVTLVAMLVVGGALLGYATWLSRRIHALSVAAEDALENASLRTSLPSALAGDELGDLSRSFSHVLSQLGDYNEYLRTLASKLSHELRTPLAIVTSSLENLDHEELDETARGYTARAKDGADRLRRILAAMSEASRVEELIKNAEPEIFDLSAVVASTVEAYGDVYPERQFELQTARDETLVEGSPELLIQMLDKFVDNAVSFSADGDTIEIGVDTAADNVELSVTNPGPPLPERMRGQLFDSMISVRPAKDDKHLGLGLYVAKIVAEGHGGTILADNVEGGVCFMVRLPQAAGP